MRTYIIKYEAESPERLIGRLLHYYPSAIVRWEKFSRSYYELKIIGISAYEIDDLEDFVAEYL